MSSCRSSLRVNEYFLTLLSTLNVACDQVIASIVNAAQDHIKLADDLTSQVIEVLKGVERKNEEAKKKVRQLDDSLYPIFNAYLLVTLQEVQFFQKLVTDRNRVYTDRTKVRIATL